MPIEVPITVYQELEVLHQHISPNRSQPALEKAEEMGLEQAAQWIQKHPLLYVYGITSRGFRVAEESDMEAPNIRRIPLGCDATHQCPGW